MCSSFSSFLNLLDCAMPTRIELQIVRDLIPFVTDQMFEFFLIELPTYVAIAGTFVSTRTKMNERAKECEQFWIRNRVDLPSSAEIYDLVGLMSPSSGAAERLISIFTSVIGVSSFSKLCLFS